MLSECHCLQIAPPLFISLTLSGPDLSAGGGEGGSRTC